MESKLTPMTDRELRSMLNSYLLEETAVKPNENLIYNMEMNIIMQHEPLYIPVNDRSENIIRQLGQTGNKTFNWTWYLLLGVLVILTGFYYLIPRTFNNQPQNNSPQTVFSSNIKSNDSVDVAPISNSSKQPASAMGQLKVAPKVKQSEAVDSINLPQQEPNLFPAFQETITTYAQPDITSDPEKHFPIDTFFYGVKRVEVNGSYFPVSLVGSASDRIHVEGEMKVEGTSRIVKKIEMRIEYKRKGETLLLNVLIKKQGSWGLMTGTINYKGFLKLTVPKQTDITVDNTSGDIHAQDLSSNSIQLSSNYGNITAERIEHGIKTTTTSGDLNVKDIQGECELSSQYGNIRVQHLDGNLNASCTSGNLVVKTVNGELTLVSSYGNIELSGVKGSASIKATSGNIDVSNLEGKYCNMRSDYGKIVADHIAASMVVKATSGDIALRDITGQIDLHSAYGSQLLEEINGTVSSKSTSGDIVVKRQTGSLKAIAVYGNVKIQESSGNYSISVNSGLLSLRNVQVNDSAELETTYGDIRIALKGGLEGHVFDLETGSGEISFPDAKFMAKDERKKLLTGNGHARIKGFAQSGNIAVE